MEKLFKCECCNPAKKYKYMRGLRKHAMKFDESFVFNGQRSISATERYKYNPKKCRYCEKELSYNDVIKDRKKQFCDRVCYRLHSQIEKTSQVHKVVKKCDNCLNLFTSSGKKYCSSKCQHDYQNKESIRLWLSGETTGMMIGGVLARPIRSFIIEQAGNKCSMCGWGEVHSVTGRVPVQIDHIDGDSTNNIPENLRVLCPNCHSLTSTYGSLNKNKGKKYRREYRAALRSALRSTLNS